MGRGGKARRKAEELKDKAKEAMGGGEHRDEAGEAGQGIPKQAGEREKPMGDRAKQMGDQAKETGQKGKDAADRAKDRMGDK